jgi:hypothetical protein
MQNRTEIKNLIFTEMFFNPPSVSLGAQERQSILRELYKAEPIYIEESNDLAPDMRCETFKRNPNYQQLRLQLKQVINAIKAYCKENNLADPKLRWDVLSNRITEEGSYLPSGPIMIQWFTEGKQALEDIYCLLKNDNIPAERKQTILKNLLTGKTLTACNNGVLSNIKDACSMLKLDWPSLLMNARFKLVQQHALSFMAQHGNSNSKYSDYLSESETEVHIAREFTNSVHEVFGLHHHEDHYLGWVNQTREGNKALKYYSKQFKSMMMEHLNFPTLMDRVVSETLVSFPLPAKNPTNQTLSSLQDALNRLHQDENFEAGNWFYTLLE